MGTSLLLETHFSISQSIMDSLNSSSNSHLQRPQKRKFDDVSLDSQIKKSRYYNSFDSYFQQNFLLPDSIIYYINKNPSSPKIYQKLIQSCKYFFIKNPILVLEFLVMDRNIKRIWKTSYGEITMENIAKCKLWITDEFRAWNRSENNIVSSIIHKIYQCNLKSLSLNIQIISLNDYIFLASNVENEIDLFETTVKNEDGSNVALEKLVEIAVKVKDFHFKPNENFFGISSNTMKEFLKIQHFFKLDYMCLCNIPEVFDLDAFYLYMKKNKRTYFDLHFDDSISRQYKKRLVAIVDEILEDQYEHDYFPPFISFSGLDKRKESELNLLEEYYNKRLK